MAQFPYAMFMSSLHFIATLVAVMICYQVKGEERPQMNFHCSQFRSWYFQTMVPIVLCVYLSVVLNNAGLIYIGAGLNGMIGLGTPVITAILAAFCGMKLVTFAWVGILVAVGGDALVAIL